MNNMINEMLQANNQDEFSITNYQEMIREAYINPIRTLVAVDDEFPTLDDLLNVFKADGDYDVTSLSDFKNIDVDRARKIIDYSRNSDRGWLVDIQNGAAIPMEQGGAFSLNLQHSDLIILDYHLDGKEDGRGEKAIEILRGLAKSSHFNMVAVYTKADSRTLRDSFNDIAISLTTSPDKLDISNYDLNDFHDCLEEYFPHFADGSKFIDEAVSRISIDLSLDIWTRRKTMARDLMKHSDWQDVLAWVNHISNGSGFKGKLTRTFAAVLFNAIIEKAGNYFSDMNFGDTSWGWTEKNNWVRVDSLFVTVLKKGDVDPNQIPDKLLDALVEWRPGPHQILMAKLRALMDDEGVSAESGVLRNKYLQKGWLDQLFSEEQPKRLLEMRKNVDQHWSGLGDILGKRMQEFSTKMSDYLDDKGKESALEFFRIGNLETDITFIEMNAFNNCKSVFDNYSLTTGHILLDEAKNHWLCLSPACDLVPDRERKGRFENFGNLLPVIMIKLCERKSSADALKNATTGSVIFLKNEDGCKFLSFHFDGSPNSAPHWEQFYVKTNGKFQDGIVVVERVANGDQGLYIESMKLEVAAQLRYEYAINLLIKLAGNMSRIGLDYFGVSNSRSD